MRLVILKSNKIIYEWYIDEILQSLNDNFNKFPVSTIRFRITKEPENKILFNMRIKKWQMFTINDVMKRLEFSFLKMIEEFKSETIKLK